MGVDSQKLQFSACFDSAELACFAASVAHGEGGAKASVLYYNAAAASLFRVPGEALSAFLQKNLFEADPAFAAFLDRLSLSPGAAQDYAPTGAFPFRLHCFSLSDAAVLCLPTAADIPSADKARREIEWNLERDITDIALEATSLSIWKYEHATHRLLLSPRSSAVRKSGFPTVLENVPESLIESGHILPESADAFRQMYAKLYSGEKTAEGVFHIRSMSDGRIGYERIHYTNIFDGEGRPYYAVGISEDVTETQETRRLFEREMQLQQVLSPDILGTALVDVAAWKFAQLQIRNTLFVRETDSVSALFTNAAESVLGDEEARRFLLDVDPQMLLARFENGKSAFSLEYRRLGATGAVLWVRSEAHLIKDPDTGRLMMFVWLRNVNDEKSRLDALSLAAETDSMTNLLNHDAAISHIESYIQIEGYNGYHALFMIDIDNFKQVNDHFGHQKGDEVILDIARAIRSSFRTGDIVGRIGGDEFLALMKDASDIALVRKKASELIESLEFSCTDGEKSVAVSGSIGVSLYRADGATFKSLYRRADAALYDAKRLGKHCYIIAGDAGDGEAAPPSPADPAGIIQLKTLLEYMDGGVLLAEITDRIRITYTSPSFYKTMRRTPGDAGENGEGLLSMVVPEDADTLRAAIFACGHEGTLLDEAYRVVEADGGVGWRHIRAARLPERNVGGMHRIIAVITDISDLKRSTAHFEAIVEGVPGGIGIFTFDKDALRPSFCNSRLSSVVEKMPMAADDVLLLIDPRDREDVLFELRAALAEDRPMDVTYRAVCGEDENFQYMHARGVWLPESGGKPVVLAILTDETHEKRMQEQLRFAELRYRTAIGQGDLLMWEVDIPKKTLRHFGAIAERLGYVGKVFEDAPESLLRAHSIHPDSIARVREMFEDIYAGRESSDYIVQSLSPDGRGIWTSGRYALLCNEKNEPYYAVGVASSVLNIDSEMRLFQQEKRFLDFITPVILASAYVNLSQNRVDSVSSSLAAALGFAAPGSFDCLVKKSVRFIADGCDREQFLEATTSKALLACYHSGEKWRYLECRRVDEQGEARYVSLIISLLRHPISGDVHAFGYLRDTDAPKRWALALGKPIYHDPTTLLYTRETFADVVSNVMAHPQVQGLCALSVMTLPVVGAERTDHGAYVANDVLFSIGRLCRFIAAGDVVSGHLDDTHIALFRANVISATEHQQRAEQLRGRIEASLRQTFPELEFNLTCGFAVEDIATADFSQMAQKALIACETAAHWAGQSVVSYVETDPVPAPAAEQAASERAGLASILIASADASERSDLCGMLNARYEILEADSGAAAIRALSDHPSISAMLISVKLAAPDGQRLVRYLTGAEKPSGIPVLAIASGDPNAYGNALEDGAFDVVARPFLKTIVITRVAGVIARGDYMRIAALNRSYELRFQHQANLLRLTDFDPLTGIYNKQAFCRRVAEFLAGNPGRPSIILRFDLDNFKIYNDAFGVAAGDRLLCDVAAALKSQVKPGNIYARLDADHFVIFLPADTDVEAILNMGADWLSAYPVDFKLSFRAGVYRVEDPDINISIMCDRALLALRSIKGNYSKRVAYYDDSLRSHLLEEQQLVSEVVEALAGERFEIYFQPQFNYDTGEIIGAEALVRWNHPTLGLLAPSRFIPLFERNGFISELDAYVWEQSCRYMRRWLDDVDRLVPVSVVVNISRLDLYNPRLCDNLLSLIEKYALPASFLKLEITESAYIENPQQLVEVVKRLRSLGFSVEMDDFGSGYSSLNTLKDVPVDILKLDMKFLSECLDSARGGSILSSVIRMAHWLKLPVIAEGVETKEQAEFLKSLGCYFMQGFYFARPMPADAFEKLLVESRLGKIERFRDTVLQGVDFFWDASKETAMLFNCFVGGIAIVEYRSGNVEVLRTNDQFFSAIGFSREGFREYQTHLLDRFDEHNRAAFIGMLDRAIASGQEEKCTVTGRPNPETGRCSHTFNRARLLAKSSDGHILFIAVEDENARIMP